jgi:hypothetical protein
MNTRLFAGRSLAVASLFLVAACQDAPPTSPPAESAQFSLMAASQGLRGIFDRASPEVMALPQTVFAARDEAAGQLVFGVEHAGVAVGVRNVMTRLGVPDSGYRIEVTEPVRFASETLRTRHRPTLGGLQIHFGSYLCTLGFNADHTGGRSFFTNSHCTAKQGENSGTQYFQPTSSVDSNPIGTEAHDPPYLKGVLEGCSSNKRCRYSDAARVLYASGVPNLGHIAKTNGVNNGSLAVAGSFDVKTQNLSPTLSGVLHKVGRTTGWTSGTVTATCATVNVFGSNIQLLCQTFVENSGETIVGSGDSGSPVFKTNGNDAELVGLLWGSSGSSRFVFSPLSGLVEDGLGTFNATTDAAPAPVLGTISGSVTASDGGAGISGATVAVEGTALSAVTDGSGNYTIANVPAGTYSVTASATGYVSKTTTGVVVTAGNTTTANFALVAESGSGTTGTVSVAAIAYSTHGGPRRDRHLAVVVRVVDGADVPVPGASVSIELKHNGNIYGTASGSTGSNGEVGFSFNNAPSGTYTTVVKQVSAGSLTWDGETPSNSFTK